MERSYYQLKDFLINGIYLNLIKIIGIAYMNSHNSKIIFGIVFAMSVASSTAFAIKLTPSSSLDGNNGLSPQSVKSISRSGVISSINIDRQTMVIDNSTYMFVPTLTKVYSTDPLVNDNPLKLKPGNSINFTTITNSDGTQRITNITLKK